jgi:hypothetical protein
MRLDTRVALRASRDRASTFAWTGQSGAAAGEGRDSVHHLGTLGHVGTAANSCLKRRLGHLRAQGLLQRENDGGREGQWRSQR